MGCFDHQQQREPEVIIIPSLISLRVAASGLSMCQPQHCGGMWCYDTQDGDEAPHKTFFDYFRRRHRIRSDRAKPPPLLLMHFDGTWDTPYAEALLSALAKQPPAFISRIVFAAQEDPMQWPLRHRQYYQATTNHSAVPRTVVVPYTLHVSHTADASREPRAGAGARPFAVLFDGRPHSGVGGRCSMTGTECSVYYANTGEVCKTPPGNKCMSSRRQLFEQIVDAGGICRGKSGFTNLRDTAVTCVLCAGDTLAKKAACEKEFLDLLSSDLGGAALAFALTLRSTFCVEGTSDTLIRTHFNAAAVGGCIPVVFDMAVAGPTQWPWRRAVPGLAALPGGAGAEAATNYSAFAVVERSDELTVAHNKSHPMFHLVRVLGQMAHDAHTSTIVRAMQARLARAAPLLGRYRAPLDEICPRDTPCDAFGMLALYLKEMSVAGGGGDKA